MNYQISIEQRVEMAIDKQNKIDVTCTTDMLAPLQSSQLSIFDSR